MQHYGAPAAPLLLVTQHTGMDAGCVCALCLSPPCHTAQVIDKSLEAQVFKSDNSSLARDCRRDMQQLNRQLLKLESWKRAERRQIRADLRQLAKEERQRQHKAVQEVINGAQVMCCTLSGAGHPQLDGQVFDVVVIDEAAQALEPACWTALLKGRRAVLAGQHSAACMVVVQARLQQHHVFLHRTSATTPTHIHTLPVAFPSPLPCHTCCVCMRRRPPAAAAHCAERRSCQVWAGPHAV